jgi:hypothetical protein
LSRRRHKFSISLIDVGVKTQTTHFRVAKTSYAMHASTATTYHAAGLPNHAPVGSSDSDTRQPFDNRAVSEVGGIRSFPITADRRGDRLFVGCADSIAYSNTP